MKKDGHFILPVKKSDPIIYQVKEVSLQDRLLIEFQAAKGLKARQTVAHEILKSINDLTDKKTAVAEVINSLNQEIASHQRTQPSVALEAIFVRDELRTAAGLPAGADAEITADKIWAQETNLAEILDQMPAAKHRKMLQSFKDSTPVWIDPTLRHLNKVSAKLAGEFAHLLIQEHRLIELKEVLARLISQHQASTELLLWLAKERSDTFADILGPEVFRAMLTAMERDQFNEKKSNRLRDFILDDQQLLVELIGSADIDVIKDLTRALQLSPCFDDMDKRSLLARIVKSYPAIQTLITGDNTKQESAIIVSWTSLERRKDEYQELVQKKIPANSKEIAIARSYGDLRENHEYKAAKEMQKILMRRKSELEQQLVRARGSDFSTARTDIVSLGTIVNVTDLNAQHAEVYTILGAWDSDPDRGVVSYLSPLAKALIGKKIGEEIEFDMDGVMKKYRVDVITQAKPVTAPAVPVTPSAEAPTTVAS
jgi:transcription elongation factor GreA